MTDYIAKPTVLQLYLILAISAQLLTKVNCDEELMNGTINRETGFELDENHFRHTTTTSASELSNGKTELKHTDVNLVVPSIILEGETIVMDCRFPPHFTGLVDSVKWYKGNHEFFRYSPQLNPKAKLIPFHENLDVDLRQSVLNKLVVRNVPSWFGGKISCEVTTGPLFKSVTKTTFLQVAVPPAQDPLLIVEVQRGNTHKRPPTEIATWEQGLRIKNYWSDSTDSSIVNLGDTILAKCESGPSTPAVDLAFLVNDESTDLYRGVSLAEELRENDEDGSVIKTAKMNLTIHPDTPKLFTRTVHIRCVAKLFRLYAAASDEVVKELPRESVATATSYYNKCDDSQQVNETLKTLDGILEWFFDS